jgi:hypothetical protein
MDDDKQLVIEALREAREICAGPRWIQNDFARDGVGGGVCALGAAGEVYHGDARAYASWRGSDPLFSVLAGSADRLYRMSVPGVNDRVGRKAVLEVYDAAICAVENSGDATLEEVASAIFRP